MIKGTGCDEVGYYKLESQGFCLFSWIQGEVDVVFPGVCAKYAGVQAFVCDIAFKGFALAAYGKDRSRECVIGRGWAPDIGCHSVANGFYFWRYYKFALVGARPIIGFAVPDIDFAPLVPWADFFGKEGACIPHPPVVFYDAFVDLGQKIRVSPPPEFLQIVQFLRFFG